MISHRCHQSILCLMIVLSAVNINLIQAIPAAKDCFNYCLNDGICLMTDNGPKCTCSSKWVGARCAEESSIVIQNDLITSQYRPPYLTAEDFERGKALTPNERNSNLTDFREYFTKHSETRANVLQNPRAKWLNAKVPYVISSKYNYYERAIIAESIREWESKTCIRFIPATSNDQDYLELTPDDGTNNYCYSYIGRQGGRQFVKMYSPTCMSVGQYVHELGHAIGFGHEHQRPDRDTYIKIEWENIDPQFEHAFSKYSEYEFTTLNMPYDYYSIMHYPDYSYSINGEPTLVPIYPGYFINNMPTTLTPLDILKTNTYYNNCQQQITTTTQPTIVKCDQKPCKHNRPCYNNGNTYYCQCGPQYNGRNCEIPVV